MFKPISRCIALAAIPLFLVDPAAYAIPPLSRPAAGACAPLNLTAIPGATLFGRALLRKEKKLAGQQVRVNMLYPLGRNRYTLLLGGSFFANTATSALDVLRPTLLWSLAPSPLLLGLDAGANYFPLLFTGLLGGPLSKHFGPKLLAAAQLVRWAVPALTAIGVLTGHITPAGIIALSLINGVALAISFPLYQQQLGDLLEPDARRQGMIWHLLQVNIGKMVGPFVLSAGTALSHAGFPGQFLTAAFVFPFFALVIFLSRPERHTTRRLANEWRFNFPQWDEISPLLPLFIMSAASNFFAASFITLHKIFLEEVFHAPEGWLGTLNAFSAMGAVTLTLVSLKWDSPRFYLRAMWVSALMLILTGTMQSLLMTLAFTFILQMAYAWSHTKSYQLFQSGVDREHAGTAFGVLQTFVYGGGMLGNISMGLAAEALGAPAATLLAGLLLGTMATVAYKRYPELDNPVINGPWKLRPTYLGHAA